MVDNTNDASALRVALVTPGYPPQLGGVEMHVHMLAIKLATMGCAVDVLTQSPSSHRTLPAVETVDGVVVRRFADRTHLTHFPVAPSLGRYLRANADNYDVIHAHSFHAAPSLMAALATHQPFVFTPHYHGVGHTLAARAVHLLYDPISRYIFRRSAVVLCVSSAEQEMIRMHFPQCAARTVVVPNGIDLDAISGATPFDVDHPVILAVGRLERYKQTDRVIDAFEQMEGDAELIIIGDGPERATLQRTVDAAVGRIRLLGRTDDLTLRRWQRTADVCVSLSRHEAFGIVVAEGVAAGASVVASDIPAHCEILEPDSGQVDFVSVDASSGELAAVLERALQRGRSKDEPSTGSSWDQVAQQVHRQYRRAVQGASV